MEVKFISSESNSMIKHIKALSLKKQRTKHMQFTVEGLRIVEECIKHDGNIEYLIYSKEIYSATGASELLDHIKTKGYAVYEVPDQLFNKIATTESPQGILAVVNMKNMTLDPYSSKTLRATMGAIFHLPIIQCNNDDWVGYLKENKVKLIAADLDTDKTYIDIDYNNNIGIIIGNEANGIDEKVLAKADEKVIIPILGKIESLNASVAAGILIYKAAEKKFLE